MYLGAGDGERDQLLYAAIADSGRYGIGTANAADIVYEFEAGVDKVNFASSVGHLTWTGSAARAGVNSLYVSSIDYGGDGIADTLVTIDMGGNGSAELQIVLVGLAPADLTVRDFVFA
jgi:hypothetical protein